MELNELIDLHLEAYAEADSVRRSELLARAWSPEGDLADPPIDGRGYDGIAKMAEAVQQHYPGQLFRRVTEVDAHHGWFRYGWELVDGDQVTLRGEDVGFVATDGRIQRIVGFFGELSRR